MPAACASSKSPGNLNRHIKHFREIHRRAREMGPQGLSVDEFRRDEMATAFVTHLVDGEYVRMIERRRCVCFQIETAQTIAVLGEFFGEQFKRNLAAQRVSSAR
jgi:hypothetical protein